METRDEVGRELPRCCHLSIGSILTALSLSVHFAPGDLLWKCTRLDASTPWAWNTCFAMSKPIVLTFDTGASSGRFGSGVFTHFTAGGATGLRFCSFSEAAGWD